jgi:hypothetical protein
MVSFEVWDHVILFPGTKCWETSRPAHLSPTLSGVSFISLIGQHLSSPYLPILYSFCSHALYVVRHPKLGFQPKAITQRFTRYYHFTYLL